jgi:hypothetical protein
VRRRVPTTHLRTNAHTVTTSPLMASAGPINEEKWRNRYEKVRSCRRSDDCNDHVRQCSNLSWRAACTVSAMSVAGIIILAGGFLLMIMTVIARGTATIITIKNTARTRTDVSACRLRAAGRSAFASKPKGKFNGTKFSGSKARRSASRPAFFGLVR